MEIREVEKKDLKEVIRLFKELDEKHLKNRIDFKPVIEIERYKRILKTVLDDRNYCMIVAVIGTKIIGFSMGKIYEVKDNFVLSDHIVGDISFITVENIFKGKGIGKILINKLESRLQKLGANKLEIRVFNYNKEMVPEKFHYQKKITIYEKFLDEDHFSNF